MSNDELFIPGTRIQYIWDSTSLGLLKECPRKYFYSLVKGYRRKGTGVHLVFGSLFHEALEKYDYFKAEGMEQAFALRETLRFLLVKSKDFVSDHPKKNRETLVRSVMWYLFHYENDNLVTVRLPNGQPAVELLFRLDADYRYTTETIFRAENTELGKEYEYQLVGRLDRLVMLGEDQFVLDRKTSGGPINFHFMASFSPDNQMSTYTLASKVVFRTPVKGVIIDGAQILVGSTAFGRGITTRSDAQVEEWLDDTHEWFDRERDYALRDKWPMNDKSCHKYDGCPFRDVCNKDPSVRQEYLDTNFEIDPWNPFNRS